MRRDIRHDGAINKMKRALLPAVIVITLFTVFGLGTLVGEKRGIERVCVEAVRHRHANYTIHEGRHRLDWKTIPETSNVLIEFSRDGKLYLASIYKNGRPDGLVASNGPMDSIWLDGFRAACYTFDMEKHQITTRNNSRPPKDIPIPNKDKIL